MRSKIIVEDFLPHFATVRSAALRADYSSQQQSSDFFYTVGLPNGQLIVDCEKAIRRVIGHGQERLVRTGARFVCETAHHERLTRRRTWVHADPHRWVAIIYLNEPAQCKGGTSFFRHVESGALSWNEMRKKKLGWKSHLATDSNLESAWSIVDYVSMVPNRLLVFDPRYFHAATSYFGNRLRNARLILQFAFDFPNGGEL